MIVALGESIVAVGIGASHLELDVSVVIALLLGLALSSALWWTYFVGEEEAAVDCDVVGGREEVDSESRSTGSSIRTYRCCSES